MKATVDISSYSTAGQAKVIMTAMKKYGVIVADNGSDWYFQGDSNNGWQTMLPDGNAIIDDLVSDFGNITGGDFESRLLRGPRRDRLVKHALNDPNLAATIEARLLADDPEAAKTLSCNGRGRHSEPSAAPSSGAMAALEALRALGSSPGGRIDLHHTLGEGGMGIVHLATQATLGRHVAVKTLRAGVTGPDAPLRILREAWVTGTLEHPNVVPVHDVGIDASGAPVILMKRIEGLAWSELIHAPEEIARRFAAADALEWNLRTLVSVCNAVHFAHSRGILHRDLKPDNVMIGEFGEVYVVDWGIAVSLVPDPSGRLPSVMQAKDIAGTPQYMAPEMLLGDPSMLTDAHRRRRTCWAPSCSEALAGDPPHRGGDLKRDDGRHSPLEPAVPHGVPRRGPPPLRSRAGARPGRSLPRAPRS